MFPVVFFCVNEGSLIFLSYIYHLSSSVLFNALLFTNGLKFWSMDYASVQVGIGGRLTYAYWLCPSDRTSMNSLLSGLMETRQSRHWTFIQTSGSGGLKILLSQPQPYYSEGTWASLHLDLALFTGKLELFISLSFSVPIFIHLRINQLHTIFNPRWGCWLNRQSAMESHSVNVHPIGVTATHKLTTTLQKILIKHEGPIFKMGTN